MTYRPTDASHVPNGDGEWEFNTDPKKQDPTPKELDRHVRLVFGRDLEYMHNTHNMQPPGVVADKSTEPDVKERFDGNFVQTEAVQAPTSKYFLQSDAKVSDFIDVMTSPDDLSML